jgi:hypothetical protein
MAVRTLMFNCASIHKQWSTTCAVQLIITQLRGVNQLYLPSDTSMAPAAVGRYKFIWWLWS